MFRTHMWLVMGALLAAHVACFIIILVFINKQKVYTRVSGGSRCAY